MDVWIIREMKAECRENDAFAYSLTTRHPAKNQYNTSAKAKAETLGKGKNMNKKIYAMLIVSVLVLFGCTPSISEDDINAISTSAAATVEARFTEEAPVPVLETVEVIPSDTPWPTLVEAVPSETAVSEIAPEGCLVANLVSETIPDGTILETGEYFFKRWYIQNNGDCTWNQEYELLYWSGDLMGGYVEYPFPDIVQPGESIELPIQLLAPSTPGTYTGYWKMRSRSGYIFGVGPLNAPISVSVDVRNQDDIEYGITSVEYYMVREPENGCPANVDRTIYAKVTVNGPKKIRYQFYQRENDGQIVKQTKQWLQFDEAGTKTVSNLWRLNNCVNAQPRFFSLVILDPGSDQPVYQYPEYMFINDCPDLCP